MRITLDSWKYLFKNLWFVLPFAILPGLFLTLSLDYTAISLLVHNFASGNPRMGFLEYFRAISIVGTDVLSAIYTVCVYVSTSVFMALMLAFVEKHMRIGKRTISGVFSQLKNLILISFGIALGYFVLYEIFAVVLSSVLFSMSSVGSTAIAYLLEVFFALFFLFALLYLATTLYLWFPCRQVTGFGAYETFQYSYRLMSGVRWRLIGSFALSLIGTLALIIGASFLPPIVFYGVMLVVNIFFFLDFGIRMETLYFRTDKLDREDLLRSYKELL